MFEHLLSPDEPRQILRLVDLDDDLAMQSIWRTRASGVLLGPAVARDLEKMWAFHAKRLHRELTDDRSAEGTTDDPEVSAFEGQVRQRFQLHRARENWLRQAKIEAALNKGELRCEVPGCGFAFDEVYGELGRHYAHVHHLKPLSDRTGPTRTTLNDLAIVCCNCHAMIHRYGDCRPLESLIPRKTG